MSNSVDGDRSVDENIPRIARQRRDIQKLNREKTRADGQRLRSFGDVMSEKVRKNVQQQTSQIERQRDTARRSMAALQKAPKEGVEQSRMAALSRAANRSLLSRQNEGLTENKQALETKSEELVSDAVEDVHESDQKSLEDNELEAEREDKDYWDKREDPLNPDRVVSRDGEQRRERDQPGGQPESAVESIEAAQEAQPSRAPDQAALIEQLVERISTMTEDGRTSMEISLKGHGLDKVRIRLRTQGKLVHCSFDGCNPELKQLLRQVDNQASLRRGLQGRGLRLGTLRIS